MIRLLTFIYLLTAVTLTAGVIEKSVTCAGVNGVMFIVAE